MKLKRILGVVLAIGIVLTSTITVEAKPRKKVHPPIFNTYTKGQFRGYSSGNLLSLITILGLSYGSPFLHYTD